MTEFSLHAGSDRHKLVDLHVLIGREQRMADRVEFLGRLEHGFGAEGSPGIVAGEQGLEFTDDFFCGGSRSTWTPESREFFANPPRQGGNNQIVGVPDQLSHQRTAQTPVHVEGIPVALVHVPARPDCLVDIP